MNIPKVFLRYSVQVRCYCKAVGTFESEFHKNHISTNFLQRSILTIGSAMVSLSNPHRGDMIACLGETTGEPAARYILNKMQSSTEGSQILKEQPRINTRTVNIEELGKLPKETLGRAYSDFLVRNNVTPDSRLPVQFIDEIEVAYVLQRYRESHDLIHTILQMPTNMLGEVTVKWVEALQFKFPMCIGAALFGPVRLRPKHRQLYLKYYLPWALQTAVNSEFLMNIYFEKRWEQPLDEFYREVNIKPLAINKE